MFYRLFLSAFFMYQNRSASYIEMIDIIYRYRSDDYCKDTVRSDVNLLKYVAIIFLLLFI